MKRMELGIFIPIANNGWIISTTAPQYMPTFDLNRRICQLAEQIGFDFVFSMSKWRGYGGETRFWDYSLESLTLMAALAAVPEGQDLRVRPAAAGRAPDHRQDGGDHRRHQRRPCRNKRGDRSLPG